MNRDPFKIGNPTTQPAISAPTQANKSDIDFGRAFSAVWRGKWLIALYCLVAASVAALWLFGWAVPRYTASATLALESQQEQYIDFENVLSGLGSNPYTVNTQIEVLEARELLKGVVTDLNLLADPEFNAHIRPPGYDPIADLKGTLKGWAGWVTGIEWASNPPSERKILDDTVDILSQQIGVSNISRSLVFQVTVVSRDPAKSAKIADQIVERYRQQQRVRKIQATRNASIWLEAQVGKLEGELEVAENVVKDYVSKADLISEEILAQRERQLKEFRSRKTDADAAQAVLSSRLSRLEAASQQRDTAAMVDAAQDAQLSQLLARLGPSAATSGVFQSRAAQVRDQIAEKVRRAGGQAATITASLTRLEAQFAKQATELLELQQRERKATAAQAIYEHFLGRWKETSLQDNEQLHKADSQVLSWAVVPSQASEPHHGRVLIGAVMAGLLLGVLTVLLREGRNATFRTAEDLEHATDVKVIGEISRVRVRKRRKMLTHLTTTHNAAMVEAVRDLRTSVMLSSVDAMPEVIMLTSSVPGEGKTTLSLALSLSIASMKKRVLLIEGDIRRRSFQEYFDTDQPHGLTAVVRDGVKLADAVHRSDDLDVDILMGDTSTENAADFFTSKRFRDFVETVRKEYDFVVIDTPPVLAVPDARVIGSLADTVLYVVRWDRTTKGQVRKGLRSFATVNVPVQGLVLSQIDQRRQKAYGHGDGYGTYAKGYYANT